MTSKGRSPFIRAAWLVLVFLILRGRPGSDVEKGRGISFDLAATNTVPRLTLYLKEDAYAATRWDTIGE